MDDFSGHPIVLGIADAIEPFREIVAALTQGEPLFGDREVEAVARCTVHAVVLQEIQAALRRLKPFGPPPIDVAEVGIGPSAPTLHPNGFIRGIDASLTVKAGVDASVLPVHSVFQPEINADVQLPPQPITAFAQARGGDVIQLAYRLPLRGPIQKKELYDPLQIIFIAKGKRNNKDPMFSLRLTG